MKVAIVGSRHFPDLARVESFVEGLPDGTRLVTGSASGVDAAASRAARRRGMAVQVIGAGFEEARDPGVADRRNQRLVDQCDLLVAFWDGASTGTRTTVDRALDSGRDVQVFVAQP
jgi:predicted Rossmann fold nucleotide-binding protein DprA/Smf involved in DNA uptake